MFITPRFVREVVADKTGRRAHGLMVRVWAAAGVYFIIGFALGAVIFSILGAV